MTERADPELPRREFSVERENDLVAINIGGPTPERLLFAKEEARKLPLGNRERPEQRLRPRQWTQ